MDPTGVFRNGLDRPQSYMSETNNLCFEYNGVPVPARLRVWFNSSSFSLECSPCPVRGICASPGHSEWPSRSFIPTARLGLPLTGTKFGEEGLSSRQGRCFGEAAGWGWCGCSLCIHGGSLPSRLASSALCLLLCCFVPCGASNILAADTISRCP